MARKITNHGGLLVVAGAFPLCFGCTTSSGTSADGGSPGSSSSSSSSGASTGSSGGDASSGGSSGASGSSSGSSGSPDGSASSSGSSSGSGGPKLGIVSVSDGVGATSGGDLFAASAQFPQTPTASTPFCSTGTAAGSCCLTMPGTSPSDAGLPTYVSAGDIVVSDKGATLATLSFSATTGAYTGASSAQTASLMWAGGDTISMSGAGATVPAFTGSIVAPANFAGLAPALSTTATAVTRSAGWTLSWTPDTQSGEIVVLDLFPTGATASHPNIGCQVQDSTGTMNIASSLLASFPTGMGEASLARIQLGSSSNQEVGLTATTSVRGTVTFE